MASLSLGRVLCRRVGSCTGRRDFSALLTTTETFPDIPATTPTPAKASNASVTVLSNGVTVVTEDAAATSTVALTYTKAGSSGETIAESGAALANKHLAFKSASGLSSALIAYNLDEEGAVTFAKADRLSSSVGYTAPPDKAEMLVPLLCATCTFEKWDVRDALAVAAIEAESANTNAQVVLTESVYSAAYGAQSPMGRPFYSTEANKYTVQSFRERTYGIKGAILSATGISDHAAFCKAIEEGFVDAILGSDEAAPAAAYMGGESRIMSPSGFAHVALAFEGPSSSALSNVLKHYISLASGEEATGFSTTGLVGVYGAAPVASSSGVVDSLCSAVTSPVSTDLVDRAKVLAKAEALFALDDGSQALSAAMTASVIETGSFSAATTAAAYDAISTGDIKAAMASLAKGRPSLAAVGDIAAVPYHGSIVGRFS